MTWIVQLSVSDYFYTNFECFCIHLLEKLVNFKSNLSIAVVVDGSIYGVSLRIVAVGDVLAVVVIVAIYDSIWS